MIRTTLLALVFTLLAPVAAAQQLRSFKSRCYQVHTDAPAADAQAVAAHMDAVYTEYSNRFKAFAVKSSDPAKLYLFAKQDDYLKFLDARDIDASNTSGIFFARGPDIGLATYLEGHASTEMYHVLQHEGFHQFAHARIGPDLPQWANEGLAEYFGQAILVKGRMRLGVAPESRIVAMNMAIRTKTAWPFKQLIELSNEDWNKEVARGGPRAGLLYDQSWTVVHFLVHAQNGKFADAFGNYLKLVSGGVALNQAFKQAFGSEDTAPFEAAWRRFMADEIEPDSVSTALERLDFLADGAKLLAAEGVQVRTMEDLKAALQRIGYTRTLTRDKIKIVQNSSDEALFDPPPGDDPRKPVKIEVVPPGALRPGENGRNAGRNAQNAKNTPVSFRVTGLRVGIRMSWDTRSEEPRARIEFE